MKLVVALRLLSTESLRLTKRGDRRADRLAVLILVAASHLLQWIFLFYSTVAIRLDSTWTPRRIEFYVPGANPLPWPTTYRNGDARSDGNSTKPITASPEALGDYASLGTSILNGGMRTTNGTDSLVRPMKAPSATLSNPIT